MTAVEIRGVWDGFLYFMCYGCNRWRHRFPPDDFRRIRGHRLGAFPHDATQHQESRP